VVIQNRGAALINNTFQHGSHAFWATVSKTVRPMLSDRCLSCPVLSCLSCLSVTWYCGQTVGRIQMKLGVHGGLGPGHSVLDVDPGAPPQRGTAPNFRTTFVALPNGSMDQDATW